MTAGLPRGVRAALAVTVALLASLAAPVVDTSSPAAAVAPTCGDHTDLDGLVGHASPVILVHGWTGAPMQDAREVFESLPSHDGRQYLLFDYAAASSKWPDVPEISRCLARYIDDVSRTNRGRGGDGMVYLVAHSMGGLAIRFALDPAYGGDADLADSVGGVVTLDTPYRGSMWGSSFFAWAKSAFNDVKQRAFPSAGSSAWRCLSAGPPAGCAAPPALPEQVPLTQLAGDVTVRRTLFGLHAYDIDLGSDGIVGVDSQWGSVGGDGKMVATQADAQMVPCTVSSGDLAGGGPVGFWADLASDNFLIDLYTKPHSPNDSRAIGTVTTLLKVLFAASCSHVTITHNRPAIELADTRLADMIRRQTGLGKVSDLRNAPIPASCRHPAARLRGYQRDWGSYRGGASLDTDSALFGDVTGDGRSDAVVPLNCNAGGVGWPQLLLVYGPGTRLVGWYDLADIADPQEHEEVDELTLRDGGVDVEFRSYEGAGFTIATYRGRLTAAGGEVDLDYEGPLTVDYEDGRVSMGGSEIGPGLVTDGDGTGVFLRPAPDDFVAFLADEWTQLSAQSTSCPYEAVVQVDRYSHLGFASGSESACGGAAYLWHRTAQGWETLLGYQDGPYCEDLATDPTLKQALTALGLSCGMLSTGGERQLGRWPESGQ